MMGPRYHVIFTENSSFLLTCFGQELEHCTLVLLDSTTPVDEHPLGRMPWIVTGIARLERGASAVMTIADAITGRECPLVTSRVLGEMQVGSVAEAMVESVLARV